MSELNRREFLMATAGGLALAGTGLEALAQRKFRPGDEDVLAIIDVTYCLLPVGWLPVTERDQIIPIVNQLAPAFKYVVMTQDWHTPAHVPFAPSRGKTLFEPLPYGIQQLRTDHFAPGTAEADTQTDVRMPHAELIIRKGHYQHIDSYSAFLAADRMTPTGLSGYMRERGLKQVCFVGLATDFCVAWSALDAQRAGFTSYVIEDATCGIDADGLLRKAWQDVTRAGVRRIRSCDIVA